MNPTVVNGATLKCSFGTTPSSMVVLPSKQVTASNLPAANIMDKIPMTNILPFGMCITLSNPQVAAATSAAQGVLTPQPCIPNTQTPWVPGSPIVNIANLPAVNSTCTLNCMWSGVITVLNPGQTNAFNK